MKTTEIVYLQKPQDVLSYYDTNWDKWKSSPECFLTPLEILIIENHKRQNAHTFASRFLGLPDNQIYTMYHFAIRSLKWHYDSYLRWKGDKVKENPANKLDAFLNMPIRSHQLSTRLYCRLAGVGNTFREILSESNKARLLEYRGIGKKSLEELEKLLEQNNCLHLLK